MSSFVSFRTSLLIVNLLETPLKFAVLSVLAWLYTRLLDGDLQVIGPLVLRVLRLPGFNSYKSTRRKERLQRAFDERSEENEKSDEKTAQFAILEPETHVPQYHRLALEAFAVLSITISLLLANLSTGLSLVAQQKHVADRVPQANFFMKHVEGDPLLFTFVHTFRDIKYHLKGARSFNFYIGDKESDEKVALEAIVMCDALQLQKIPSGQVVLPQLCTAEILSFDQEVNETVRARIGKMKSPFIIKKLVNGNPFASEIFEISPEEGTFVLKNMAQMLRNPVLSPSVYDFQSLISLLWNKEVNCGRYIKNYSRDNDFTQFASMQLRVWFTVDPFQNVQLGAHGLLTNSHKCGQSLKNTNETTNAKIAYSREYDELVVHSLYLHALGIVTVLFLSLMAVISYIRDRKGTGDPAELLAALCRQVAGVPSGSTSVGAVKLRESWKIHDSSADARFGKELHPIEAALQVHSKVDTLGLSKADTTRQESLVHTSRLS